MPIEDRPNYIIEIKRILDKKRDIILETFEHKRTTTRRPYKFSEGEIRQLFRYDS